MNTDNFEFRIFPKSRLATLDVGKYGKDMHYMFGLLEVDVTEARQAARLSRQAGQGDSLTAWMIIVIANTVSRHMEVRDCFAVARSEESRLYLNISKSSLILLFIFVLFVKIINRRLI